MFCVIQETKLKKPNTNGAWREYEVSDIQLVINGITTHHYGYYPVDDAGKFERPQKEAYRISLHFSYRQDGKPRKRQYSLCTASWYDFADGYFSLYDWAGSRIERAAEAECVDIDRIYEVVNAKVEPLEKRIQRQFHKTEEYKAERERKKLLKEYQKRKAAFAKQYGVSESIYDNVYDVFGTLRDADYLARIQKKHQQDQKWQQAWRSYSETGQSTYGSSTFVSAGDYSEADKARLKEFYRVLSKTFHPDMNPARDTSEEMKLINRLKEDWGL